MRIHEIQMLSCDAPLWREISRGQEYKVAGIVAETWNKISVVSKQMRDHGYFNFSFTHKYSTSPTLSVDACKTRCY